MNWQDNIALVWPHLASIGGSIVGMAFAPAELTRRGRWWSFFAGLFCAMFGGPIANLMFFRSESVDVRSFSNFAVGVVALAVLPVLVKRATQFSARWELVKKEEPVQ